MTPKDTTTIVESIRVLRIARCGAVKARTAGYNQLKDLILTAPDELRERLRGKTLQRVAADSVRLRPDLTRLDDPTQATKLALRSIALRIADLSAEITTLDGQLRQLIAAAAPRTLALLGVGPDHAAQLLITAGGNPERLHSEAAFAALCGASPAEKVFGSRGDLQTYVAQSTQDWVEAQQSFQRAILSVVLPVSPTEQADAQA